MILTIILLIAGLALIVYGADFMTDGASDIARRFGISELVVGLTIVAFGTSAPELAISIISSAQNNAGIAVGNVVGSNIFNTLLIVGLVALMRPITIGRSIMVNEIPLNVLSTVALVAIGCSMCLDGTTPVITRVDGILLLLFFAVFMRYIFSKAKDADSATDASPTSAPMPMWRAALYVAGGLAALIWGGQLFVDKATAIAHMMGVSDALIGLTIVAIGTSLPELAASLVAARKGNTAMALGNVIGSNIFNILLVLSSAAVVRPLPFGGVTMFDLATLMVATLLFWIFGWWIGHRVITRAEGALLTTLYIIYIIAVIAMA